MKKSVNSGHEDCLLAEPWVNGQYCDVSLHKLEVGPKRVKFTKIESGLLGNWLIFHHLWLALFFFLIHGHFSDRDPVKISPIRTSNAQFQAHKTPTITINSNNHPRPEARGNGNDKQEDHDESKRKIMVNEARGAMAGRAIRTSASPVAAITPTTTSPPGNENAIAAPRMSIETAVFLDNALSSRYTSMSQGLADLNKLVLTIMNQVKYMFLYSSLMRSIDIKLVLVESLKDSERRGTMKNLPSPEQGDIDLYLSNFCQWQQARLETNKEQLWWDHAILLSGLDLYKASPMGNQTGVLGLSWVGGMCKGNYSCTVGEAIHLESAFVIAHEIGHSLGMMHDGNKNNCDPNKFIMSDKTGAGKINWSRCSNTYLGEALKRNQLTCLNNNTSISGSTNPMYDLTKLKPPGQVYSLNDQCRLAYGGNYSRFISNDAPYNNVCQELWCVSGSWARPVHPALEGSYCERNQVLGLTCREGKCV